MSLARTVRAAKKTTGPTARSVRMRSTSGSYADRDVRGALSSARADLPRPRRVLLTNDDGPDSPFFHKFAEGLRNQLNWPTFVCIPSSNWSYVSKSLKPPEGPFEVDFTHSKTDAEQEARCPISPASCVNLGLYELAKDCDLVVSGPNIGHNLGRSSILSSGTVGAALEGCVHGRRAIAMSFPFKGWGSWTDEDVSCAVEVALDVTGSLWRSWSEEDAPGDAFYNVNVPLWAAAPLKREGRLADLRWVRTTVDAETGYTSLFRRGGEEGGVEKSIFEWHPTGQRVFDSETALEGGDVAAVRDGHVSITKLAPTFQGLKMM
ncbi:survival 5'/3'-nucleotidase SurE [Chloropicon roscoffensis]|uniref:Survival 5'/3'-nucleotidase SurE n=1 Tax=Chloropicon roscoffensis TaxID=1461544 RepID=A0A7S3FUX3_9CHLO|mmetsp:Transcript_9996/g.30441  ORF Transcript_9996/g.30441 Transcript_9996/m.30441 type:complete len:320 (+) Transcript_9996:65-1024(+)